MMEGFLEWMLEASLLVLLILAIRKVFMGKIRYGVIYALWGLVLLRFLLPGNMIATPVSIENLFLAASNHIEEAGREIKEGWQGTGGILEQTSGMAVGNALEEKEDTDLGIGAVQGKSVTFTATADKTVKIPWKFLLPMIWAGVSPVLFSWFFLSNVRLLGKMRKRRVFYGKRGNIKIYLINGIQSPCLYGFFRPAIYLPFFTVRGDGRVSKEELGQIITHEFVHYRHGDHIWAMIRMLFVSAYWFNPFIWIASSCSKKDAELYCDETVIQILGEEKRFCYGEMLVRLAGRAEWGDFRYSMLLISRRGKEMERRIRAISGRRHYSKWVLIPLMAALCLAAGITCSAGMAPVVVKEATTGEVGHVVLDHHKEGGRKEAALQSGIEDALEQEEFVLADSPQKAFDEYLSIFTEAVNSGNADKLSQVLEPGSDIYLQQCRLVKNYHKRGIREKVKAYSVSIREISDGFVEVDSDEKIRVTYADGISKIVKQQYCYTCRLFKDEMGICGWIITDMQEILL